MQGCQSHIVTALTDPYLVVFDKQRHDVENFYRPFTLPKPYDRAYLKVVVRFHRRPLMLGVRGEILTAYATNDTQAGEKVKWPLET